jgi:chromosome segregation ATPase
MGEVGMRALQALIDKAEFEVRQGTPQDIASRGLFEACAEVIEGQEDLEKERDELAKENVEYSKAVGELRGLVKDLLDEDVGDGDPEPGDILDAYKTLAQEIDELRASVKKKDARIEELERLHEGQAIAVRERDEQIERLTARLRELEPAGEERAALIERVRYLESGLGRIVVEAYKLRKGAL